MCTHVPQPYTWICEMYMGRSLHIYIYHIEHRNLEIQKTRNDFSVQVRKFLLPLSLKVLRHKERGTIFLFWLFHLNTCGTRYKGLHEQAKTNRLPPRQVTSPLVWLFQNLPKSSARFRCVTSFALFNPVSHLGYCDISEWHVHPVRTRMNTCFNVAPK